MTTCSFRMVRGPGVRADCTLIGRYFDGLIHSSPALHVFRQQRKHKIAPDAAIGVFFSPRFDSCFGLTDSLSFFCCCNVSILLVSCVSLFFSPSVLHAVLISCSYLLKWDSCGFTSFFVSPN